MNNAIYNSLHGKEHISEDIDIQNLLDVVWHQKKLIILLILSGALLTFFLTSFLSTSYTARSNILINSDTDTADKKSLSSLAKSFTLDIGFILTEIEILKSRGLAASVVKKLNLDQDPEFNTALTKHADILDTQVPPAPSNNKSTDSDISETVTNFLEALKVKPVVGSSAVEIIFTSQDPEKATLINNTLIDEYIRQRTSKTTETQNNISKWLDNHLESIKNNIVRLETEAEDYRAEHNLTSEENTTSSIANMTTLNNQRLMAEQDYIDAKMQLKEAKKLSENPVDSSLSKILNTKKSNLETELLELSSRYGYKHPIMIEKNAELDSINRQLEEQTKKSKSTFLNDFKKEVNVTKAKLRAIESNIKTAKKQNDQQGSAMIKLRQIENEADALRDTLKTLRNKYKGSLNKAITQSSNTEIISRASVPTTPSSPNKNLIRLLGIIASLALSLIIAFFNEKLYNKFRGAKDLERKFGFSCIAKIPHQRTGWNKNIINEVLSNSSIHIVEAIRNLRLSLHNFKSEDGTSPKVISLISSVKNEGKTITASLIAALAAKAGERVILIDTNLRSPQVHEVFKFSNDNNLVDYLTHQKELKDVIIKHENSGLDMIFGSAIPNNAFNLLSMDKLDNLIEALKQSYDLIILDTPACLEASDARLIEQLSDISLYSVKANSTKHKTVEKGVKPFLNHTQNDLAFVLTHSK